MPDPVDASNDGLDAPGVWMSDADPMQAVMMQVPDLGGFLRVLVSAQLSGGHAVTFGAWLGVHPEDLQRAFEIWWTPN